MSVFPMPDHPAADCHVHIYDDAYPFVPNPRYIPDPSLRGTDAQLARLLDAHGLTHALLVSAAPYGGNNGPVLDAIARRPDRFRGIALVPDPEISDRDLRALHEGGMVGVRVNLALGLSELGHAEALRFLERIDELGWFLDIHCERDDLVAARPILRQSKVRVLIDHCGRPDVSRGFDQKGFEWLLELGREGRGVVKLSGPFRFSRIGYPYDDVDRYIAAAIDAYGLDNCVWGSDWPFVNMGERVDYGPPMQCLSRWLPDAADRCKVLWDTPARLFGFRAVNR